MSQAVAVNAPRAVRLGLRQNVAQFTLLVIVNAFVGAMAGMERGIHPLIAEQDSHLVARAGVLSFIVVFGVAKALTNYGAGRLSDLVGRFRAAVLLTTMLAVSCSSDRGSTTPVPADHSATERAAPTSSRGLVVGKAPVAGTSSAFVELSPRGTQEVPPPDTKAIMDQVQLTFIPSTLIVRAGYPVQFHSSDEELHNINVKNAETRQQEFNVAIPPGQTFEHTFKNPGFYDVNCDIHPAMSAQIFVATSPYVVMTERDGSFTFQDVIPGAYTLSIYAGTRRFDQTIQVSTGRNDVHIGSE